MVRPHLLIIYFFLVIHTQASPAISPFSKVPPSSNATHNSSRPCHAYNRCRTLPFDDSSTLASGSRMRYGGNLTSENGAFTVGFFLDGNNNNNNNNAYLGTWYNILTMYPKVIVWVANRDNPIPYPNRHNCSLIIDEDGSAKLFDYSNNLSYWSTPSNPADPALTYLRISDNGNLELFRFRNGDTTTNLWQSFDYPTDTFLPGMDIRQAGINLTSWKTPQDPSKGDYSFRKSQEVASDELLMYNRSHSPTTPYWGSNVYSLYPDLSRLLWNTTTEDSSPLVRLVMTATGSLQLWELEKDDREWSMFWAAPKDQCDFYDPCGSYGVCDAGNSVKCKCLPGYYPTDPVKWESGDFSGGCSKKTADLCGDKFLPLPMMKLPPHEEITSLSPSNESETECGKQCASDCGCKAYSIDADQSSCLIWRDDLSSTEEEYSVNAIAHTLYIRLNHLDIVSGSRTCDICGANVVPYPLSTRSGCGDPNYFSFECNATNGQVYFNPPTKNAYKVSHINPDQRQFTLQLVAPTTSAMTDYKCEATHNIASKTFNLSNSSAFDVTKCSVVQLMDRKVVEVDVSWKQPSPPACNSSEDCKDWPESTCDGKKVCICTNGFHWNSLNVNCTRDDHHRHMPLFLKVGIASAAGLCLLSAISFVIHLRRRQNGTHREGVADQFKMDDMEDIDIPFFDYESIVVATDNFSDANMLGAGGFGPVYKGLLVDGNEVAVKRLSAVSLQGVEEFRNEIMVIAKLQHRNLVRVLGYCIKDDEKILIYEYMPNKSLDSFLYDQDVSPLLDWTKRFNIILGIARGLLYLHQDSRLRIIHRDLKPSNILLDEELNPKISDFGLAKIVAGNEMAANTARVAGTYGYMSPEYALDGYFSIKSDVYSFGIIVFEVISGRRCTSLLQLDSSLVSLLGYAWKLWGEGRELELADKAIGDTYDSLEVKRCINVAFLCVQEDPSDRPTMSSALLMLSGDKINLPHPKQPVFVARRQPLETTSSSSKMGTSSNIELTTTVLGR